MKMAAIAVGLDLALVAGTVLGQVEPENDYPSQPARPAVFRAGVLAAYRELYDLSIWAGGLGLSVGGEGEHHGGHANVHGLIGKTRAGLPITEIGLTGTYEMHFDGARFGVGGGLTYLGIGRATAGPRINSIGFGPLLRLGYDFGERSGAYVLGQYALQQFRGAIEYGPSLWVGWRW
jgi:hypothetical protein